MQRAAAVGCDRVRVCSMSPPTGIPRPSLVMASSSSVADSWSLGRGAPQTANGAVTWRLWLPRYTSSVTLRPGAGWAGFELAVRRASRGAEMGGHRSRFGLFGCTSDNGAYVALGTSYVYWWYLRGSEPQNCQHLGYLVIGVETECSGFFTTPPGVAFRPALDYPFRLLSPTQYSFS